MPIKNDINSVPLYNSRIVDNYIKLLKKNYKHVDIGALLSYANMTSYEVADEGHWFTQEQINKFHEKLSQLTNNENIAREAGRYAASSDAIGRMRPFVLGMLDPDTVYNLAGKTGAKFTKSSTFNTKKLTSNKVEITVTPINGAEERPFQCENRIGFFEAITFIFNSKLPTIEHTECMHKGAEKCKYIVSWERSISSALKKIRNYTVIFLVILNALCAYYIPTTTILSVLPISMAIILIINSIGYYYDKKELRSSINYLQNSTDQLIDQIETNYNNTRMTNEIGQTISKQKNIGDILHNIVQIFKKRLDYDRCMILLANNERDRLVFRTGFGYTFEQLKLLKETAFHLNRPDSKGVFVLAFHKQESFLINNVNEIEADLSSKSLSFARKLGTQSFICCPIISDGDSIGILAVDNLRSKIPLIESDISLLMGIASVLGICIRNAELIEAKEKQFRSLLQVLAASIDARDPLTSGHSEKVTEYAVGICEEMGLEEDYKEVIRVAALLHDYGKIGVPDSILKKRGRLSHEEYEIVKNHAEKTKRILEQISFEGIFAAVPNIAGAHHERFDGKGYPEGTKGKRIPVGARIIAVADFFEAITSRRPYRDPIALKKAFRMLEQEKGKKLDSKVVEAFINYFSKKHAGEPLYRLSRYERL